MPNDTDRATRHLPVRPRQRILDFGHRVIMLGKYAFHMPAHFPATTRTDLYYLGHHKCASAWIRMFLMHLAPIVQANYRIAGGVRQRESQAPWLRRTIYLNLNSNAEAFLAVPADARGFHVVRDPRDALVSDYFSRRYSHTVHNAWHAEMRTFLEAHSMEDGLIYMMDQGGYLHQMEGWDLGSRDNILDVRYEDLLKDELGGFARIVKHLEVEVHDATLKKIVDRCSFKSLAKGRRRGQEDSKNHFRKGIAGDWRNHMPVGSRVHQVFQDRWADLVERLGYEV